MNFLLNFLFPIHIKYNDIEYKILKIINKNITLLTIEDLSSLNDQDIKYFADKMNNLIQKKYWYLAAGFLLNNKNELCIWIYVSWKEIGFLDKKILHKSI